MIRLAGIHCAYGSRTVLTDISLDVQSGETLALLGPNSAGKSTLLKVMGGLMKPSSGTVWLKDRSLSQWTLSDRAACVAWVPSEADFTFSYTVEEMVMLGRTPYLPGYASPREQDQKIVQRMLGLTDVLALAKRPVDQLSSGERQRVLLARALAQEPSILLMDEPTAHLDIGHSYAFFRALDRLRQEQPLTVVLATHDLTLAKRFSTRVALLRQGRLHAIGDPAQMLQSSHIQTVFEIQEEAYL